MIELCANSIWEKELSHILQLLGQQHLIDLLVESEKRDLLRLKTITKLIEQVEEQAEELSFYEEEVDYSLDEPEEQAVHEQNDALLQLIHSCDLLIKLNEGAASLIDIAQQLKCLKTAQIDQFEHSASAIISFLQGVKITMQKMEKLLSESDLKQILPHQGAPFSPHLHRAVGYQQGGLAGTIAGVVRCGYQKKNKILRFADVIIYS